MNLYFDIGGTHFRFYLIEIQNNKINEESILKNDKNIFTQLDKHLNILQNKYIIKNIIIALPGIIKDYCIYGVNNLDIPNGYKLLNNFNNIPIKYINDGDAFVIGETINTLLTPSNKNILGIIFGTGVGSGLIINGQILFNSEIFPYLENFMKENYLTNDNIELVTNYIAHELTKIIKLLNLDYVLINGYVNKFNNFEKLLNSKVTLNKYYNTKIIVSQYNDSNLVGLKTFNSL